MTTDPVVEVLVEALRGLIRFVDERPEGATFDDDVRALEEVAAVLGSVEGEPRERLRNLLGPEMSEAMGLEDEDL